MLILVAAKVTEGDKRNMTIAAKDSNGRIRRPFDKKWTVGFVCNPRRD